MTQKKSRATPISGNGCENYTIERVELPQIKTRWMRNAFVNDSRCNCGCDCGCRGRACWTLPPGSNFPSAEGSSVLDPYSERSLGAQRRWRGVVCPIVFVFLSACGRSLTPSLVIAVNAGVEGDALKAAAREWSAAQSVRAEIIDLP